MVRRISTFVKTYPVTMWASVGVFAYLWKASIVATMYEKRFQAFDTQRREELRQIR